MKRALSLLLSSIILLGILSVTGVSAAADYHSFAAKLDKRAYSGQLGSVYTREYTDFYVWAPTSDNVKVRFYKTGTAQKYYKEANLSYHKQNGVWSGRVKGNLKNKYYTYVFERKGRFYETYDLYAKACGLNGKRSMVVDLESTNPRGWDNDHHVTVDNQTDAKIWEVQIADFSSSKSSGVSEKNRGKFLAFTESGTTVDSVSGAESTCVDYLKKLGVNYVQINPFYDFGSIDEGDKSGKDSNYNWGYDPVNYNCPEGSYSSDASRGAVRIKECKQMIQALHTAGIGVIMDVVYNHTQKWKDSAFNLTVPGYYYRMNPDGSYSNGSGCGNDTASEHKMFSKFMVDSVKYWAEEYHIDGFRFDLMGLHDVDTMNTIRHELDGLVSGEKLLMYGEAWDLKTSAAGGTTLATQDNVGKLDSRIGAFDDTYRDAVKGSTAGADKGFVQSGIGKANLKTGIMAQSNSTTGWAKAPTQTVTYASCHDNLTLWDKLVISVKGKSSDFNKRYNDLVAMNKLAGAITFTSQGIPFILAGEELCRTKQGDENSYKSGFKLNAIDWTSVYTYGDVSDYYRGLMEIRDNISSFRDPTSETADNMNFLTDTPAGVVAYTINDSTYGKVCVIFNSSAEKVSVKAEGRWARLCDGKTAGMKNIQNVSNKVELEPVSACVLVDKDSYDSAKPEISYGKTVVRYVSDGEVFKSYAVTGKIGDGFNITPLTSVQMDYNIVKKSGAEGTFSDEIHYCEFECEKYDGSYSSVTFESVDDATEKIIGDSTVMTNRRGQPYKTLVIPTIDGYTLNLDKLPKNACGTFGDKNIKVSYRYTKKTSDDTTCRVNIVYMSTTGKILGTDTLSGDAGAQYSTNQIDFEGYEFSEVTDNNRGTYAISEQNVLYIYEPVSPFMWLTYALIIFIFAAAVGLFIFYSYRKRKKELMSKMEIS